MPTPYLRWKGPDDRPEVYPLRADQIVIGRSSGADVILTGPNISRRHARIVRSDGGFSLIDLQSSYGTYVNDQRIEHQPLQHGDRIRLGPSGVELLYLLDDLATTQISDILHGPSFEKSLQNLTSVLAPQGSAYSDLEKISCILDFHYYCGSSFSPATTFQQILKSALEISGAERGFILMKTAAGFRYELGLDAAGTPLPQSEFRTSLSVVRRVSEEGTSVFMTEQIGAEFAQQESIVSMKLRSLACLPLEAISSNSSVPEVVGILYLDSTHKMHSLSRLDHKILTKLAEQAGNVLDKLEMIKNLEERRKIEQEFALAQETQRSLLPRVLPQFENFHIHAFNQPTRYVGGDFYDFLQTDSGKWAGILADVSGKGISAALLSSLLQGALTTEFRSRGEPEEVLNRVNRLLFDKTLPNQFVTLFLFLLDSEGKGQFISAGHNPAYLFRSATGEIEQLVSEGLILGAFEFATYQARPFRLGTGDILVVYSDGLTEAQNQSEEFFGEDRLLDLIRQEALAGGPALRSRFLKAIEEFTQGMPQSDDITFLIVEKSE
jgi:phosphoserine phosphatase RsbU/P